MRNYKFHIIKENIFIDLNKFRTLLLNYKEYQIDNSKNNNSKNYFQNNTNYDYNLMIQLDIGLIKCNFEKYTGIIVKFKTPIPDKLDKLTTVKIFSSGKINIDGSNNFNESSIIKNIISSLIYNNKDEILYSK